MAKSVSEWMSQPMNNNIKCRKRRPKAWVRPKRARCRRFKRTHLQWRAGAGSLLLVDGSLPPLNTRLRRPGHARTPLRQPSGGTWRRQVSGRVPGISSPPRLLRDFTFYHYWVYLLFTITILPGCFSVQGPWTGLQSLESERQSGTDRQAGRHTGRWEGGRQTRWRHSAFVLECSSKVILSMTGWSVIFTNRSSWFSPGLTTGRWGRWWGRGWLSSTVAKFPGLWG